MIEPRQDAYGAEADTSHIADYMELLALARNPLRKADLADYLADLGWVLRSSALFHETGGTHEDEAGDEATSDAPGSDSAERVFTLLTQRQELLGDLYPFTLSQVDLQSVSIEERHRPYLTLLAVTVAHHYSVDENALDESVESIFEHIVNSVMTDRGLLSVNMAAASRGAGNFREAVERAATRLELLASPEAARTRTHANEEGVDTVSHFPWGDTRPGHWIFIGQSTCGQSNSWDTKIMEPKDSQWGMLLNSAVNPIPYLAVPHHVEDAQLGYLSHNRKRMVIDRVRLCRNMTTVGAQQELLIEALLREDVFHPSNSRA